MAYIPWKPELNVGIAVIDQQHQQLVAIINELFDAMKARTAHAGLAAIVKRLGDYTEKHFSFEEDLLRRNGYAELVSHMSTHKVFVAKIRDYQKRLAAQEGLSPSEVLDFLGKWLTDHIQGTDKKYAVILIQKGVR